MSGAASLHGVSKRPRELLEAQTRPVTTGDESYLPGRDLVVLLHGYQHPSPTNLVAGKSRRGQPHGAEAELLLSLDAPKSTPRLFKWLSHTGHQCQSRGQSPVWLENQLDFPTCSSPPSTKRFPKSTF